MESKHDTNELMYKAESLTQKTSHGYQRGKMTQINQEVEINTILYQQGPMYGITQGTIITIL